MSEIDEDAVLSDVEGEEETQPEATEEEEKVIVTWDNWRNADTPLTGFANLEVFYLTSFI